MQRWVTGYLDTIFPACDYPAIPDNHCADWHVIVPCRPPRARDCDFHKIIVGFHNFFFAIFLLTLYYYAVDCNLQIISGKFRGRKLALPADARPTQNRARIAVFNMLNELLSGDPIITVWYAFAGSGAFGLECLSRDWAGRAIFTDINAAAIRAIKTNARRFDDTGAQITILQRDAIVAAPEFGASADLIFIDPPYAQPELGARLVEKLAVITKPGTIIVWETEGTAPPAEIKSFTVLKDKTYGRARFLIMRKI